LGITALVLADGTEQAAQPAAGDQQSEGKASAAICSPAGMHFSTCVLAVDTNIVLDVAPAIAKLELQLLQLAVLAMYLRCRLAAFAHVTHVVVVVFLSDCRAGSKLLGPQLLFRRGWQVC
jgi:hypothetical protein